MYNPIGYTSIFELKKEALKLQIMGLRPSDFLRILLKTPKVHAVDSNGVINEISKDIFAKCGEEFAFIECDIWKITFDLMRETTSRFKAITEGRIFTGMAMLASEFSTPVLSSFPDTILKFEGSPLFLLNEDAEMVLDDLKGERETIVRSNATNHETMDEVEAAYKKFVISHTDPRRPVRAEWCKNNHLNGTPISRTTERDLRERFVPDSWKMPGRR